MKKYTLLFSLLLLFSCSKTRFTYSFSSTNTLINTSINFNENYRFEKIDDHHLKYYYQNKEIDYYAEYIIDGEYYYQDSLYETNTRNQISFLVIDNGILHLENTSFLKDGDAYEPRTAIQYGKNALITVIGNNASLYMNYCAINIFSKGSSLVHIMHEGKVYLSYLDIVITDEYSAAYSYYNTSTRVKDEECFIFIDNEKSQENVLFYDE